MDSFWRRWIGLSLRLGMDFSAAILVSVLIGRGIDFYLGSYPWGLVIFIILGIMAGGLNIYRSAILLMKNKEPFKTDED